MRSDDSGIGEVSRAQCPVLRFGEIEIREAVVDQIDSLTIAPQRAIAMSEFAGIRNDCVKPVR
jgi:hypothetical protein